MLLFTHIGDTEFKDRKHIPSFIKSLMEDQLLSLDEEYGSTRNYEEDDGGYLLLIEDEKDFEKLQEDNEINFWDEDAENFITPEYNNQIILSDGTKYRELLVLFNNDYAVIIYVPESILIRNMEMILEDPDSQLIEGGDAK